ALDAPQEPEVYFAALQSSTLGVSGMMRSMRYVVRARGAAASVFAPIRQAVRAADAELPIVGPAGVADDVAGSLARREFNTILLGGFAVLALVLAAAGIYGLMAYSVTQRTREIGIRLAIGATPVDVLQLVVGQTARMTSVGLVVGIVGAVLLTRVLTAL